MPLTPTDVANKQFRIAFRGYSLDEVDAFLDEVETELSRLLRDNASLKDRPEAPSAAAAVPVTAAPAPRPLAGMEGQEAALRTLLLAQRTADEAIAEARAEAEQIVTAARSEADSTLTSARSEAQSTLEAARAESTGTLDKARTEADRTLKTAQDKAASIDVDVASRIQAATGDLDQQRRSLEARIEELQAFEREYRTRLKAYLETQLRDLDSKQGPDDGGAGVPAGARAAAVGLTPGSAAGVRPRSGPLVGSAAGSDPTPAGPTRTADAGSGPAPAGPPREADAAGLRAVPAMLPSTDDAGSPMRDGSGVGPVDRTAPTG